MARLNLAQVKEIEGKVSRPNTLQIVVEFISTRLLNNGEGDGEICRNIESDSR